MESKFNVKVVKKKSLKGTVMEDSSQPSGFSRTYQTSPT